MLADPPTKSDPRPWQRLRLRPVREAELQALHDLARDLATPPKVARRARIVLDFASGIGPQATARRQGVSRVSVHTWVSRFNRGGVLALHGSPRGERMIYIDPAGLHAAIEEALSESGTGWGSLKGLITPQQIDAAFEMCRVA